MLAFLSPVLLSPALIGTALACPTVVTGTPSELSFDVAQVAIVRQDNRTTFSVSINPAGPSQSFALVMPVPEVLEEHEIETLDPEIFGRLDGYSGPRHVSDAGCGYGAGGSTSGGSTGGGTVGSSGTLDYGTVDVEAEYLVGEYEIVILSAEKSTGLLNWLDDNAYYLPTGAEERLQEYIDAGSYFLAAKVADEAAVADGSQLSPLKLSYDSEIFSIPIRLATLNSPGEQDMVIYSLTERSGQAQHGKVGISNYTEFEVADTCIWGKSNGDFGSFYEDRFTQDWETVGDAGWTVEYAGAWYDCSPCSGTVITEDDIAALGFAGNPSDHYFTRIRMRYTPDQADQDLTLYASGLTDAVVTPYADDNSMNRQCREYCDDVEPGTTDPGTTDPGTTDPGGTSGGTGGSTGGSTSGDFPTHSSSDDDGKRGCATVGGAGALAAGLALLGLARRRQR